VSEDFTKEPNEKYSSKISFCFSLGGICAPPEGIKALVRI